MEQTQLFPQIVNITDLRYRWTKVAKKLEKSQLPILVVEHSKPRAVIFSFGMAQKLLVNESEKFLGQDPLVAWRKKYAPKLANWDATAAIRRWRDLRWNLS